MVVQAYRPLNANKRPRPFSLLCLSIVVTQRESQDRSLCRNIFTDHLNAIAQREALPGIVGDCREGGGSQFRNEDRADDIRE